MISLPVGLKVLAVVQAGGQGSRLDVLTRERAKPALPFAGVHALIDFPLSVLANSGIKDVWVSSQFQASSLDEYLSGGRPWDLDRSRGGFRRLTPEEGSGPSHEEGFSHGNADDLFRMREEIRAFDADVLVVLSADHVFNLDLRPVIATHLQRGSDATLLTARVGVRQAKEKLVVDAARDGRVREVWYKPDTPAHHTVATEIFLYRTAAVLATLDELHRDLRTPSSPDDTGLGDFGEHLMPALVAQGSVHAVDLVGYWKDVGRPTSYLQAHRDLLAGRVTVFGDPDLPIIGAATPGLPGWVRGGGQAHESLLSPGAQVRGRVLRSVIGPGVRIEPGAVVQDSVILNDVRIEHGAQVRTAILDAGVRIGREAVVGATPAGTTLTDGGIVLIGRDSQVGGGARIEPGARLEPGTTV